MRLAILAAVLTGEMPAAEAAARMRVLDGNEDKLTAAEENAVLTDPATTEVFLPGSPITQYWRHHERYIRLTHDQRLTRIQ